MSEGAITAEDLAKLRSELKTEISAEYGETIANLRTETERERAARVAAEARANEKPAEKPKTADELQELVDAGHMTQAQATNILLRQERQSLRSEILEEQRQTAVAQKILGEIERYKKSIPAIADTGSAERGRLSREFDRLVELGLPGDATTELAALRAVFGAPEGVEERTGHRPASQEDLGGSSGRGESARPADSDASGAPKDLPARQREFYEDRIKKGMYPGGWKNEQLKKELSYVPRGGKAA